MSRVGFLATTKDLKGGQGKEIQKLKTAWSAKNIIFSLEKGLSQG